MYFQSKLLFTKDVMLESTYYLLQFFVVITRPETPRLLNWFLFNLINGCGKQQTRTIEWKAFNKVKNR